MLIEEKDIKHLEWIHDRIVGVYNESKKTDYLIRMREIIKKMRK